MNMAKAELIEQARWKMPATQRAHFEQLINRDKAQALLVAKEYLRPKPDTCSECLLKCLCFDVNGKPVCSSCIDYAHD